MKGILDRFEDNEKAVVLIEEINEELIVARNTLPEGSEVDTHFTIEKRNGVFVIISIDDSASQKAQQKSSGLMDQLRAKSKGSKFKK
ncbi:hypothetical protein CIL05_03675 [Virgibacillus profundi]|uniref:DUF3006 domain-containing protein n=1 Tax=Virgibacillus profundi TaxID=2024555 RepID=A0A2A2IFQ5_9BACI|nr:DUF3006 domain-containing protein [Virgibacillus profundi]PAV30831.1 hypothetical protein CIL05_03675 [Virgibacillus profundi]PXY55014.1 DUF3006 domain-containing protein [Virgibacillus profundi]